MSSEEFTTRNLTSIEEFEEVVSLQRFELGLADEDIFPHKLLTIASNHGGMAVGAVSPEGKLVGFVSNFPGYRYGRIIEWSYLLCVLASARGRGLERRLKLAQRDAVLERGVSDICWAFSPFDFESASRSLNDLGAQVVEYATDFPDPFSVSQRGSFKSDVLIARWKLEDPTVVKRISSLPRELEIPNEICLIKPEETERFYPPHVLPAAEHTENTIALPVPISASGMSEPDRELVKVWSRVLGKALKSCLSKGYVATGISRLEKDPPGKAWYILERKTRKQ